MKGRHADLAVLSIDPKLENTILSQLNTQAPVQGLSIDPPGQKLLERIAELSGKMRMEGQTPQKAIQVLKVIRTKLTSHGFVIRLRFLQLRNQWTHLHQID